MPTTEQHNTDRTDTQRRIVNSKLNLNSCKLSNSVTSWQLPTTAPRKFPKHKVKICAFRCVLAGIISSFVSQHVRSRSPFIGCNMIISEYPSGEGEHRIFSHWFCANSTSYFSEKWSVQILPPPHWITAPSRHERSAWIICMNTKPRAYVACRLWMETAT